MPKSISLRRHAGALALLAAMAAMPAHAKDRPFQSARTAVAEDDDEGTWSIESWVQRHGTVRGISVEPEYTFTPYTSVQMEFTRLLDKRGAETGHEAEVEFKHLFNQIARDGWGWGVSAALTAERTRGEGTQRSVTLKLPLSVTLGDTGALLHLNAGLIKPEHARRESTVSAAAEMDLMPRVRGFVELAREGREKFGQIGVRHWLKRDHLALDFSLQQRRLEDGRRASGFILGVGWYDL
jgi:hypothetical protein